jgi:hypothetical protein
MTSVTLRVELPRAVEEQARTLGILTSEKMAELIAAEVERQRQAAAARLSETMDRLSAKFREEYGHLLEDEALALIDQWLDEAGETPEVTGGRIANIR